jgi:plastocyanin
MRIDSPSRPRFARLAVLMAALLALGLFAACSSSGGASSASDAITIKNFAFTTSPVTAGSTVTVKNNDSVEHTVTSDDGSSFNVSIQPGKTATFTAPKAGTYKFHCNIHSQMHGSLTVT